MSWLSTGSSIAEGLIVQEFRLLLRSWWVRASLLATAAAVMLSLWLGWIGIVERRSDIEQALALQSAQHAAYLRGHPHGLPDAGDVAYYTFHAVPDPPAALAWLSLGDRTTRPAVLRIRMLGLQSQLYDGEANNPEHAAAGTFDFGFAVVFLLPLLCIGLCHDLGTQDREQGRAGLLSSLVASTWRVWSGRIVVRYLLACSAVLLPLVMFAVFVAGWSSVLWWVIAAVALYAALWTAICAWIGLRWRARTSAANAMSMLALWAIVTMALPALAGSLVALWSPIPQGSSIALAHRKYLNDAWDMPKETTFAAFFRAHPEWRSTPPVTGRFHWKWYYAFQHVADLQVEPMVAASAEAMRDRDRLADVIGLALPPVAMQNLIDGFAGNGVDLLIAQRGATRAFHDRLRIYFYPFVFEEQPFTAADFVAMPKPQAAPSRPGHEPFAWIGLWLAYALMMFALSMQLPRRPFV